MLEPFMQGRAGKPATVLLALKATRPCIKGFSMSKSSPASERSSRKLWEDFMFIALHKLPPERFVNTSVTEFAAHLADAALAEHAKRWTIEGVNRTLTLNKDRVRE